MFIEDCVKGIDRIMHCDALIATPLNLGSSELVSIAPPLELCTDNGAMIAWAGLERLALGMVDGMDAAPRARWLLDANASVPGKFANTRAGF